MVSQNRVAETDDVTGTRNLLQQPVMMSPSRVLPGQRAKDAIKHLCETDDRNMQKVGAANLNLNNLYCESIIKQANRSFWSALVAAVVGLIFFLGAAAFLLLSKQDSGQVAVLGSLGTAITACVSGTSFYLYRYTMGHFEAFHLCLARTEIVLLENSVCKQIEDVSKRDAAYASVVENIEKLTLLLTASRSTKGIVRGPLPAATPGHPAGH
jgi:hypothetical protein